MRTGVSSRWQRLYQAAILETDVGLLLQRIVWAENAISDRVNELDSDSGDPDSERAALAKAFTMLGRLRRLAHEGKAA